ncbi:MAG: prolyl oligopeptidase family serine peptidase [Saprospiraceae bacterium]|nr:prolyl oligopeptidase family serine peptidase [Saprospiraceae bacterium]
MIFLLTVSLQGQELHQKVHLDLSMDMEYLMYLPEGYDKDAEEDYPMLVYLHGGGGGESIEYARRGGPPSIIKEGKRFPFIVLCPYNPEPKKYWNDYALIALIDKIIDTHAVDTTKVYLAGMSRGAYGAWRLAIDYPAYFAALVVASGVTPTAYGYALWIKELPIWVFHGTEDDAIPFRESVEMVEALERAEAKVRFTPLEGMGHSIRQEVFDRVEIYEWMLTHSKK